jgi:hypothetical protein
MQDLIIEQDQDGLERINRINYEVCVLQALRAGLRCREIWALGADKFRNPDEDLPTDFEAKRAEYFAALNQSQDAEVFVLGLQTRLRDALTRLNDGLDNNDKVRVLEKDNGHISLTPLEPLPEPPHLASLKSEIGRRWPMTLLLDILKEAELRIGLTNHFRSVLSREILSREVLQKRLLLCLYGLGTNMGLKRVAAGEDGVSYSDLRYVRRRFMHRDGLKAAIADVVNAILDVRKAEVWGDGTTSCASDAKTIAAWDQNLMTALLGRSLVASALWWAWRGNLLARGAQGHLYSLAPQDRVLFRSRGHD